MVVINKYRCPKCESVIGEIVEVDGAHLLMIRGFLVTTLYATCECGEPIHFRVDTHYIRLIKAIQNTRRKIEVVV